MPKPKVRRRNPDQLAPQVYYAVKCKCTHARLIHAFGRLCTVEYCRCEEFEEVGGVPSETA
jgi:hypothetical protein